MGMLVVCTDWQKQLLEVVASRNERKNRSWEDLDAAFTYLFFQGGNLFNPPDCPSFVKLSHDHLIELKDALELFLSSAEDMGFDSEVKEAIAIVNDAMESSSPRHSQRKIRLNSELKILGTCSIILLLSWITFSFKTAFLLACFTYLGSYISSCIKKTVRSSLYYSEARSAPKFYRILRKLNSCEINARLRWAEYYLLEKGWIDRKRYLTEEERHQFKEKPSDFSNLPFDFKIWIKREKGYYQA